MESVKRTFDLLTNAEKNFPKETALAVKRNGKWETFSTADYRKYTDLFSIALLNKGFKKGDKIATVSNNRPEWNFVDMGMTQLGCVHVSIYPTISDTEYQHILSHSEAKMLIVSDKDLYERLKHFVNDIDSLKEIYTFDDVKGAVNWQELFVDNAEMEQKLFPMIEDRKKEVSEDDLLTLIYTSGTTGLSKGVMLTHKNVISNVYMSQDYVANL